MLAQDLIRRAFRLINTAGGTGETPTSDEADDALSWLNALIDEWADDGLTMYRLLRTAQTLTASTASYSVGTGGTINIVRPVEIRYAGLILDRTVSVPLEAEIDVLTDQQYARWPDKTQTSTYPRGVWYDHNWSAGLGLVYPLPIPDNGNTQLVLYTPVAILEFADLATTDYTFPPSYETALEYNLAVRLAVPFGRDVPESVARIATGVLARIRRRNLRLEEVTVDPTMVPRRGPMTQREFDGGLR